MKKIIRKTRGKHKPLKQPAPPFPPRNRSRSLIGMMVASDWSSLDALLEDPTVDLEETDQQGLTPLMYAAMYIAPSYTKLFIERGANVQAREASGLNALHLLAKEERVCDREAGFEEFAPYMKEVVDLLLAAGLPVDTPSPVGMTPLMYAALYGAVTLARHLLDNGADLEKRGLVDNTPLLFAVSAGGNAPHYHNTEMISFLLERGADPAAADEFGRNAFAVAVEAGCNQHVEILFQHNAPMPLLSKQRKESLLPLIAAARCDLEGLREALSVPGSRVDARTDSGRTPLMWAAARGFTEGVEYLLEKGADIHTRDRSNWSAIELAACYGHHEAARALLRHNPNLKGAPVALTWAVKNKDHEMITVFLEAGAPVRTKEQGGPSIRDAAELERADLLRALHKAGEPILLWYPVATGDEELTRKVLAEVMDPAWVKSHGVAAQAQMLDHALNAAAMAGRVEMIHLLLEHGAAVNRVSAVGDPSVLIVAAQYGQVEAVKILLEAGADPAYQDYQGWNAEEWAELEGHTAVSSLLAHRWRILKSVVVKVTGSRGNSL